jgi:PadR family transcriptional regulator PadR
MHDLTGFQRDCLYIVAGLDGAKGLAVKDELDEYYENEINHGRLYPNLDALVEKGHKDDRTNSYDLTKRGSVRLRPDASGKINTLTNPSIDVT